MTDPCAFLRGPHPQAEEPETIRLFRAIPIVDGESTEPVRYVGVHPVKWSHTLQGVPDLGFVEADTDELERVTRQRDELLAVLKIALEFIDEGEITHDSQGEEWPEVTQIRSAIADVEADE